jgi:transcriptional regulator with XRE-family HTH domain
MPPRPTTIRSSAVGRALVKERLERHLSREDFAELLGMTVKALDQWEYGHRTPSEKVGQRWAQRLGLPAWHFLGAINRDRMARAIEPVAMTSSAVGLDTKSVAIEPPPGFVGSNADWLAIRRHVVERLKD